MTAVEVYLYGALRRHAPDVRANRESIVQLEPRPGETVATLLERLDIHAAEVCHVFLNGALLHTDNSMAPWLGYQEVPRAGSAACAGLDTSLKPGDRLGLFAHDMALLVV
jgi:hypothetical protein